MYSVSEHRLEFGALPYGRVSNSRISYSILSRKVQPDRFVTQCLSCGNSNRWPFQLLVLLPLTVWALYWTVTVLLSIGMVVAVLTRHSTHMFTSKEIGSITMHCCWQVTVFYRFHKLQKRCFTICRCCASLLPSLVSLPDTSQTCSHSQNCFSCGKCFVSRLSGWIFWQEVEPDCYLTKVLMYDNFRRDHVSSCIVQTKSTRTILRCERAV